MPRSIHRFLIDVNLQRRCDTQTCCHRDDGVHRFRCLELDIVTCVDALSLPKSVDLMYQCLLAISQANGSARRDDLYEAVLESSGMTEMLIAHDSDSDALLRAQRRVGFALSELKRVGAADNVEWGVWSLTDVGREFLDLGFPAGDEALRHREHEFRVGQRPVDFFDRIQSDGADNGVSMTVRQLLAEWDVKRRGSEVVTRIQRDLKEHGIVTLPRFDQVAIDDEILVRWVGPPAKAPDAESSTAQAIGDAAPNVKRPTPTPGRTVDPGPPPRDEQQDSPVASFVRPPEVTIGNLRSASAGLTLVAPEAPIAKALSLMESNDFSQLAVGTNDRSIAGSISWTDIGRANLYGAPPTFVKDAMEPHPAIAVWNDPLVRHVAVIAARGFVFVRDRTNRVNGIVTSSDLSVQFLDLAKPFLLIGEIEGWIRATLDAVFSLDELRAATHSDRDDRVVEGAKDLTFGEYSRFLGNPSMWDRIGWSADRAQFCQHLEEVREVRNDVMHFSPDPIDEFQIERVEKLLEWIRRLSASQCLD